MVATILMVPILPDNTVYPAAVLIPLFSLLVFFLDLGPFVWHCQKRHLAQASLIGWLLVLNLINFLNAVIWPRDDYINWWNGEGLCDIEVRLMVGAMIAVPGSVTCIMRDLANVMDTKRMSASTMDQNRGRKMIIDVLLCVGLPIWYMIIFFTVHTGRYYIFSIQGCYFPLDSSWVSVALIMIWPPVLSVLSAYYAVLVVYRLHRYRRDFSRILRASNTTRSRFLRLFSMTSIVIIFILPMEIYELVRLCSSGLHAYSWDLVHSDWNTIAKWPTQGTIVQWDHMLWIFYGLLAFVFFGTGKEATRTYRVWADKAGLGKLLPASKPDGSSGWLSLLGSKTKGLWEKMSSTSASRVSRTSSLFGSQLSDPRSVVKNIDIHVSNGLELPIVEPAKLKMHLATDPSYTTDGFAVLSSQTVTPQFGWKAC